MKPIAFCFALVIALCFTGSPVLAQSENAALKQALQETLRENVELRIELEAARKELDRLRGTPIAAPVMSVLTQPISIQVQPVARTHTVARGETLGSIATRYYGNESAHRRIFEANRNILGNPNVIHPGQVLTIP